MLSARWRTRRGRAAASTALRLLSDGDTAWNATDSFRYAGCLAVATTSRRAGHFLVAGSRTLVHSLMEHDLVDEYRLMIFPVVLGSGRRLFPETREKTVLTLADTKVFDSGVVVHTYHPAV
ncbi:MAG: dihydrofolate reductase family protein [Thermoleophilaceae bacterium]|nr:dihydrofolate reductase family protein [Thermoleophilaceae bacterium]